MPALSHGKQRMRRAAFIGDVRLNASKAASGVQIPAEDVLGAEYEQWVRGKFANLDTAACIGPEAWAEGGQNFDRFKRMAGEACIVGRHGPHQVLPQVDFAAFKLRGGYRPSHHLGQLHLYLQISFLVAQQESRKRALDHLW